LKKDPSEEQESLEEAYYADFLRWEEAIARAEEEDE
jgi:hypothetical protein